MYVEDLELPHDFPAPSPAGGFLISTAADLERVRQARVISLVINAHKGIDAARTVQAPQVYTPQRFQAELHANFTGEELRMAEQSLEQSMPQVRQALSSQKVDGQARMQAFGDAVEQMLSASMNNAAAMLALARLKRCDETTFLHSISVSVLMISFARALKLDEDSVRLLGIGGLVHDLGKVAVPVEILTKGGRLTPEEFTIIKQHPKAGFDMLREIDDVPPVILDICLYHHEQFDGTGYPYGLAGEAIPYAARIAAICDVYDAMTTIRPYKPAWSQDQALDTMLRSRGHFDPELLGVFMSRMMLLGRTRTA